MSFGIEMTHPTSKSVRLCHLYPKEMNIYADRGNIAVLAKRLTWRGMTLKVTPCHLAETINPDHFDLFYLGGGQDSDQALIARDLTETKASALREAFERGAAGLFVCGGYQLAGHSYETKEHGQLEGLGILDITTVAGDTRLIGDILIEAEVNLQGFAEAENTTATPHPASLEIVGYENHLGRTFLGQSAKPFGKVKNGHGNNNEDKTEGAIKGHVIGTYLHGPLFPRNPLLADLVLLWALSYRYDNIQLPPLEDGWEQAAHASAMTRSKTGKRRRGKALPGNLSNGSPSPSWRTPKVSKSIRKQ